MTDIVERLTYRAENLWSIVRPHAAILDLEAAAEIIRLRKALEEIVDCVYSYDGLNGDDAIAMKDIASEALLESERAEDHSTFT